MTDAALIVDAALRAADPYRNVYDAVSAISYDSAVTLVAVGKAAFTMAKAAYDVLGEKIKRGFVLTKYGHGDEPFSPVFTVREAGHPVPDVNSVKYTDEILSAVKHLTEKDRLLFLVSGGASALFESPLIELDEMQQLTEFLLKCSADITEINTIRKRLSAVKGGRFAQMCPCRTDCIVLSDVLGDRLDIIASGPCFPDSSTTDDVRAILEKYNLPVDEKTKSLLMRETPSEVRDVNTVIAGNVVMLCSGAAKEAERLGYDVHIVTTQLTGEAAEKAKEIVENAVLFSSLPHSKTAFIYGGETTVTVKGSGMGGRNQEMALTAAIALKNTENITFVSLGSDGTDGPTDAAGGIADGTTYAKLLAENICPEAYLDDNNSYEALKKADALLVTGPTGTNVNDIVIVLVN